MSLHRVMSPPLHIQLKEGGHNCIGPGDRYNPKGRNSGTFFPGEPSLSGNQYVGDYTSTCGNEGGRVILCFPIG